MSGHGLCDCPRCRELRTPPLSKPNPARARFWRLVLAVVIVAAYLVVLWVDKQAAGYTNCVSNPEARNTVVGERLRVLESRVAATPTSRVRPRDGVRVRTYPRCDTDGTVFWVRYRLHQSGEWKVRTAAYMTVR